MMLGDILSMGDYTAYVWSAYGLTLLVLVGNILLARRRHSAARLDLGRRLQAREGER
ncbi:MAG: heme exporter protein CcmD [Gammaproteobacteria bacterium]|nr:heme exporter protein CcmD [Gammaproteobacteria bacterium]